MTGPRTKFPNIVKNDGKFSNDWKNPAKSFQALENSRELPKGWRWVKLGEVCFEDRCIVEARSASADKLPYLSLEHVESHTGRILRKPQGPIEDEGVSTTFFFTPEHVLYGKLRPYLNKVALPDFTGRCTTEIIPLRCNEQATSEFLALVLRRQETVEHAMQGKTGSRMPRADMDQLLAFEIPLPPLPEQKRIAAVLNEQMAAVERARKAAEERLATVIALSPACHREAFGDTPTLAATPLVPSSFPRPGWTWHRLTDLARLATGHTPSRYHGEYWNGDIPWIQLADIRSLDGREAHETSEHTNTLGIENSAAVLLPKGTVCLSRTASVGFVTIMGRAMATSQDFVNWVCGDNLAPWFLLHLFIANRRSIVDLGSGAVHHTIYFPTVESFSICIPQLPEQLQIAAMLKEQMAAVEQAQNAAAEEMATVDALPGALLRRAFVGEL